MDASSQCREKRLRIVSFRLSDAEFAKLEEAGRRLDPPRTIGDGCRAVVLKWVNLKIPEAVKPRPRGPKPTPPLGLRLLAQALIVLGQLADDGRRNGFGEEAQAKIRQVNDLVAQAIDRSNSRDDH